MPESVRIAVAGAAGRMGRSILAAAASDPELVAAAGVDTPGHALLGADIGLLYGSEELGVPLADDIRRAAAGVAVVIDFSHPDACAANVAACREAGTALVVGTTGLVSVAQRAIDDAAKDIAVVQAPNMSIGVNLCFKLTELAARALGDSVDVEIIEAHHRDKIDAPSGTALRLGEVVAEVLARDLDKDAVYGREGRTGARERRTIGFETIRAGDIVGEHTVLFAGAGERVEVTHRASTRDTFAHGALRAAKWSMAQPPGRYDMQDVLGLR